LAKRDTTIPKTPQSLDGEDDTVIKFMFQTTNQKMVQRLAMRAGEVSDTPDPLCDIGNVITPTEELIFFRGVGMPLTSILLYSQLEIFILEHM
jgi:hypothetical protein